MVNQQQNKKLGVWIDFERAHIIQSNQMEETIKTIDSNIEHFNLHGGSRSSIAYGPQDNVSESKLLERKKHQQRDFYNRVIQSIEPIDKIVLFGPAEAKVGLKKALNDHSSFRNTDLYIETADSMSENQLKAWLRSYTF